jgi:hypothetical protein
MGGDMFFNDQATSLSWIACLARLSTNSWCMNERKKVASGYSNRQHPNSSILYLTPKATSAINLLDEAMHGLIKFLLDPTR